MPSSYPATKSLGLDLGNNSATRARFKFSQWPGNNTFRLEAAPPRMEALASNVNHISECPSSDNWHDIDKELRRNVLDSVTLKPPISDHDIEEHEVLIRPIVAATFLNRAPYPSLERQPPSGNILANKSCGRKKRSARRSEIGAPE